MLKNLFGKSEETPEPDTPEKERITGKIYHLGRGWGFISSPDLEFTRIFFHWTGLHPGTLNFKDLKKGMKVEFEKKIMPDESVRAIRLKVIEEDKSNEKEDSNQL